MRVDRVCSLDAVAAGVLCPIQGGIGAPHEIARFFACDQRGDAEARRKALSEGREAVNVEVLASPVRQDLSLIKLGLGQHQHELLTAVARDEVGGAYGPRQQLAECAQDLVAGIVTVMVVDQFEAVDVRHDDAERSIEAPRPRYFSRKLAIQIAPVGDAGQRVGHDQLLNDGLLVTQQVVGLFEIVLGGEGLVPGIGGLEAQLLAASCEPMVHNEHQGRCHRDVHDEKQRHNGGRDRWCRTGYPRVDRANQNRQRAERDEPASCLGFSLCVQRVERRCAGP